MDDEGPHHDLCRHVECLGNDTLAVDAVTPKATERYSGTILLDGSSGFRRFLPRNNKEDKHDENAKYSSYT